jgi:long-chain acyl-CoA synthetase
MMLNPDDHSIAEAILVRAHVTGSRPALSTPSGTVSGNELAVVTHGIAEILRHTLPGSGRPVLIVMGGDPNTVAALLACDLAGRTAVLLHAASTAEQIRSAAVASGAELLLQEDGAPILVGTPIERTSDAYGLCWTDLSLDDALSLSTYPRTESTGFLCHQTSGTMAGSKLALRTRSAARTEIDVLRRMLSVTEDDVVLCCSSVSHSYGCIGGLLTPLLAGATVILARDPEEILTALSESVPSIVFGLGPMYAELVNHRDDLGNRLRNVRFAFSAGASLPPGLFERFRARFAVPIRQDYGTSETGTISLDLASIPQPQCVGQPLPHVNIRLEPPARIPLEPGEEGEILVQSRALACGYLVDGHLTPCADTSGWYRTQDAGSWARGGLCVGRRLRPLFSINGELVNLDQVERAIEEIPGVVEVVVAPGTDAGHPTLVAGVRSHTLTGNEIRTLCIHRLPRNWVPDRITVYESLPRSPAGKILNRYL